ncbi:branched-chain amino acid ABC transporter permease [Celeribacter baekdonensis]|uniref:Branched-chain amino acid ABC transporter permease n=1 Tax=Celeribacter baekdonensis TaxID=875171 RepID=A0A2R4LXU5_9RHOB|nr:branched-chain amino acid ABC transporter permease [Celeribacter baekdonensis]AVW89750.1 branched-chain amino acid ABC transporter permease [Celeribacter baekdonensis]|tara:strand:- start:59646 stop:60935 length:1290 start_codon:yes stop_codon:yes gene_type:complete
MTINTVEPTAPERNLRVAAAFPWAGIALTLVLLPMLFTSNSMMSTLNYLGTMAIFALSYNVLLGQTGLLSLGHGTFFGLGGFVATHAVLRLAEAGMNFPLPLIPLIGGLGAFALGVFGGWLSSGRGGMPFAMITLGLAELVYAAAALFPSIYGSEEGVSMDRMDLGASFGMAYGANSDIYVIVAVWFLICAALLYYFTRTPLGLLTNGVRDNAERIEFLGFSARRIRMSAYAIAAGIAGVAGSLAALNFEIITVNELGAGTSTLVLLMTYIGGTRHFFGPVLGAIVIGMMKVWLSDISPAWMMYFGLLFIFVVMVAPGGLAGILVNGITLMRSGTFGRQAPLLTAIGAVGAAMLFGLIVLVELGYRAGLDAALGPKMSILGLPMDASAIWSWGLGGGVLSGGALVLRMLLDRLATLRHALGTVAKGELA